MELLDPRWCSRMVDMASDGTVAVGDLVIELQCKGAPRGLARIGVEFAAGRVVACGPGARSDADITLTMAWDDFVAVLIDELNPAVAFMRGDLKTDGPTGPLLALLTSWSGPRVMEGRRKLMAETHLVG